MNVISEHSCESIFRFACSSIQDLHKLSLVCRSWYKIIRQERILLDFVNSNLQRFLRNFLVGQHSILTSDDTFMAGSAALSVLCGIPWLPCDVDMYSQDFRRWGFSLPVDKFFFCYERLPPLFLPEGGKRIKNAICLENYDFFPKFMVIRILQGPLQINLIEIKSAAKKVLDQYAFPFLQNALVFEQGKVTKVILGNLKSLVSYQGDLNWDLLLSYLNKKLDVKYIEQWKKCRAYKEWQQRGSLSLTQIYQDKTRVPPKYTFLPGVVIECLDNLEHRIEKYAERGFWVTQSSIDSFLIEVEALIDSKIPARSLKRRKKA